MISNAASIDHVPNAFEVAAQRCNKTNKIGNKIKHIATTKSIEWEIWNSGQKASLISFGGCGMDSQNWEGRTNLR